MEVINLESRNRADATIKKVRKEIEGLLHDRFDVSEDFALRENDNFFGMQGLFGPRELTYVSYMLEARYGIQFDKKEYDDPKFYSISGLSEIVAQMLSED